MKQILILMTIVLSVILSSCTKSDSNDIIKDHKTNKVSLSDTTINIGSKGNPNPNITNGEAGTTVGHPSYISRSYKVKRLDSLSIYVATSREVIYSTTYTLHVGDTINLNIYLNEIRSKDQFTRPAVIIGLL